MKAVKNQIMFWGICILAFVFWKTVFSIDFAKNYLKAAVAPSHTQSPQLKGTPPEPFYTWSQAQKWSGSYYDGNLTKHQQVDLLDKLAPEIYGNSDAAFYQVRDGIQTWLDYGKIISMKEDEAFHHAIAQILFGVRNGAEICSYTGQEKSGKYKKTCRPAID